MARVTFNIGLLRSKHSKVKPMASIPSIDVLHCFSTMQNVQIIGHRFERSETEPTLVLYTDMQSNLNSNGQTIGMLAGTAAGYMACALDQDAIAWYSPDMETGGICGPRSADWGEFNEQYFLF